jgi:hypothetical protein
MVLCGFSRMLAAIAGGDYHVAAIELKTSKLAQQAPARVSRLVALLLSPSTKQV